MAALLTRRAFPDVALGCGWYTCSLTGIRATPGMGQFGVDKGQYLAARHEAKEGLPGVDPNTWARLMNLCWPEAVNGWDGEWDAHRAELLSLGALFTRARDVRTGLPGRR